MRDQGLEPVSVKANQRLISAQSEVVWRMEEVIGRRDDNADYLFESQFEVYSGYSRNESDKIDLVVSIGGVHYAPREVKLTVVPDSATVSDPASEWGPELVMRPVSSAHAMMSVGSNLKKETNAMNDVVDSLRPAYDRIDDWDNQSEIRSNAAVLAESLSNALALAEPLQRPFLIQPIWKTQGQSHELCERCFDVFVWSDLAVLQIALDRTSTQMTRFLRESARHVRGLFELLTIGSYSYTAIYKGMSLGLQTDKSFSLSGKATSRYLRHARLQSPVLRREVLSEIVLNRGERELKPERRFDAAVVAHMMRH